MMQIQKCVKPEIKGLSIIGRFRNRNKWYKKTETARKRKSPVRLAGVRKIGPQIARAHVGCPPPSPFWGRTNIKNRSFPAKNPFLLTF